WCLGQYLSSHSRRLIAGYRRQKHGQRHYIIFALAKLVLVLSARAMRRLQSSRRLSISTWMLSPGVQRWPAPAARRARACSSVSASTHHSSTRVTSILAWNRRGFVSGAASGTVLGARKNALLAGMI